MSLPMMSTLAQAVADPGAWMLPVMVLLPLIAGVALLFISGPRDTTRMVALGVSVVVFLISLVAAIAFDWSIEASGTTQLAGSLPWVPNLGVSFSFGIDAISMWMILLTTFLMPLTILGTWEDGGERSKEFYLWLLVLQGALIGVFAATDIILFYVFFELTLVPLFFLIGVFGSTNRLYAAYKFFVFTLAGSLLTFAGIVYVAYFNASLDAATINAIQQGAASAMELASAAALPEAYHHLGEWTFNIDALMLAARGMDASTQAWVMLALMIGFAVKVPLFPVHTWLPLAHTEAPTAGSVVLAGVLLKLGSYGMLRFVVPFVPDAVVAYAPVVGVLCVIGILYAALICWVQSDIKKLVAYSSVSHMGFCVLGLFALNPQGVGGSVIYMINHGLSTGALFLCVGMIYNRYHTRQMDELGGLGRVMPVWSFFMVFFCLASVGLPGLNGFVGEFLTIFGAFTATHVLGPGFAAFAALGLIFGAIYILYMVGRVVVGPLRLPARHADHVSDLNGREIATLAPLAVACLVLGLYPTPLLRSLEPSIDKTTAAAVAVIKEKSDAQAPAEREVTAASADALASEVTP